MRVLHKVAARTRAKQTQDEWASRAQAQSFFCHTYTILHSIDSEYMIIHLNTVLYTVAHLSTNVLWTKCHQHHNHITIITGCACSAVCGCALALSLSLSACLLQQLGFHRLWASVVEHRLSLSGAENRCNMVQWCAMQRLQTYCNSLQHWTKLRVS